MPYNPNITQYPNPRPETGQTYWVQSLLIQNFAADKYIVIDKEIKGGLHRVKYKSQLLVTDKYDGIFNSRRVKGMLCYVEFEDDDTPSGKYYKLNIFPGTSFSHWEEIGSGANVTLNNPRTVPDLPARDALTPISAGDFVNVGDARTPQEIIDLVPAYSASYIYDGSQWIVVHPYGQDPDRHVKNYDTQLVKTDNTPLTADQIDAHIKDETKHKVFNDLNDAGAENEAWTSSKTRTEIDKKFTATTDGDGTMFLADDGTYKAVQAQSGAGLKRGDILDGGNSQEYV